MQEQGQLGKGREVHGKAVVEHTGVGNQTKGWDKLVRTGQDILGSPRSSSLGCSFHGSRQLESLADSSVHSFHFPKPLDCRGTDTSTRSQFPKLGEGPLHSFESKE